MDFLYNYRRKLTNGLKEVQLPQNFIAFHPHLVKYYEENKKGDVFHFTLTLTISFQVVFDSISFILSWF